MKLAKIIDRFEALIPRCQQQNLKVSKVNVAWQIDHTFKVILSIYSALEKSNPEEFIKKSSRSWKFLKLMNWIPRGKGKAPKIVLPEGEITEATLRDKLKSVKVKLKDFDSLDEMAFFTHPYFGNFNKKEAYKFLEVHSFHHLKIAEDIVKS